MINEYKIIQSITNSLHKEKINEKKIYEFSLKKLSVNNDIRFIQLENKHNSKTQKIYTILNITIIVSFVGGLVVGIKIR